MLFFLLEFARFFRGFKSMDILEDWDEGDSFLFSIWDSLRGSGIWGLFSLLVVGWGIFAYCILSNDFNISSWLMVRDVVLVVGLLFSSLGGDVGF